MCIRDRYAGTPANTQNFAQNRREPGRRDSCLCVWSVEMLIDDWLFVCWVSGETGDTPRYAMRWCNVRLLFRYITCWLVWCHLLTLVQFVGCWQCLLKYCWLFVTYAVTAVLPRLILLLKINIPLFINSVTTIWKTLSVLLKNQYKFPCYPR